MIENVEQLVEVMARALHDARRKGRETEYLTWEMLGDSPQNRIKSEIQALLLAAQAEGAEVVLTAPTPEMEYKAVNDERDITDGEVWLSSSTVSRVYESLLTANPLRIKDAP